MCEKNNFDLGNWPYNANCALKYYLLNLWLNPYFSVEKPKLYEKCRESVDSEDEESLDYVASFTCFIIDYSQSIALTAVNTILPALFTKMIQFEG